VDTAAEVQVTALQLKVKEDREEFLGHRIEETDEFFKAWSAAEHRHEEAKRARCLRLFVDPEDDRDAGPSSRQSDTDPSSSHHRCDDVG
jgi:hypothetical protein